MQQFSQDKIQYLRVITTNMCNMNCTGCHREGQEQSDFPFSETLLDAILICLSVGIRKVKFMGGEPTLCNDLDNAIVAIKRTYPDTDISMISNGTASLEYYNQLFCSGLDRLNISVHGWGVDYFLQNTSSNKRLWTRFRYNLLALLKEECISKINYVIKKGVNEDDLFQLINDLSSYKNVRIDVLNYLLTPNSNIGEEWQYSLLDVEKLLKNAFGIKAAFERLNKFSLPSRELVLNNGVHINLKVNQLNSVGYLNACTECPVKKFCIEGITAVRLSSNNILQPCIFRNDNCFRIDTNDAKASEKLYEFFLSV